jgi:chemotaxis protein MotB
MARRGAAGKTLFGAGGHGGGGVWLMSYADMVTLLLAFFVVMYTMSQIDINKLKALVGSLNGAFDPRPKPGKVEALKAKGHTTGETSLVAGGAATIARVAPANGVRANKGPGSTAKPTRAESSLQEVVDKVSEVAKAAGLEHQVHTRIDSRGAVVSFSETADSLANVVPFASGSAELTDGFKHFLDKVAPLLAVCTNKIEVQGHTDHRPIHTVAFPSNWELSGARAGSVVRYLVDGHHLRAQQFVCTGFADTMPVNTQEDEAGWARNRRIEIIITRNPIATYDASTRDQAFDKPTDITKPLGPTLINTGLPGSPKPPAADAEK